MAKPKGVCATLLKALDSNSIEGGLSEMQRVRAVILARAVVDDYMQMQQRLLELQPELSEKRDALG